MFLDLWKYKSGSDVVKWLEIVAVTAGILYGICACETPQNSDWKYRDWKYDFPQHSRYLWGKRHMNPHRKQMTPEGIQKIQDRSDSVMLDYIEQQEDKLKAALERRVDE